MARKRCTIEQIIANLTADGRLVTRQGYRAALGLGHAWSDTLSSNLAFAWTDLKDIGERAPDAIQSGAVGHLNLIWAPREKLSTGIELMWGTARTWTATMEMPPASRRWSSTSSEPGRGAVPLRSVGPVARRLES